MLIEFVEDSAGIQPVYGPVPHTASAACPVSKVSKLSQFSLIDKITNFRAGGNRDNLAYVVQYRVECPTNATKEEYN